MKRLAISISLLSILLTACSTPALPAANTITVFAATSLTDAFIEIGKAVEADHPGMRVVFNFAGSQALRTQIEQGAPADVFASANGTEMQALFDDGLVDPVRVQIFVTNSLVVVLAPGNPAGIQSLADLARPGLTLVLAAEEVPAGRYARQALENLNTLYGMDYQDAVLANVASNEENVRLVLTKVQLDEADAGIVYLSDAVSTPELPRLEIPADFNVLAQYPIAALVGTEAADLADAFIAYVLSPAGQAILEKWGFTRRSP